MKSFLKNRFYGETKNLEEYLQNMTFDKLESSKSDNYLSKDCRNWL